MSQEFSATILKSGVNPYVDVPPHVSRALGREGYIPVKGTIEGKPFRSGIVSLGDGRHRLFINGEMRRSAGVGTGDRITVTLEYDPSPRVLPLPGPLARALEEDTRLRADWEALNPSRRKEILSYLNSLKKPETIRRNVGRVLAQLEGER